MRKKEDRNTRYFVDLDLRTGSVIGWDYDQRDRLIQNLAEPLQRVFITMGQYNKLEKKHLGVKTEENVRESVPFFSVANIEESVGYYVEGLGFTMTDKWIDAGRLRWCRLQQGGAGLMLQEFPKEGHDSWVPQGKVGEGVSIYFICNDALAIYREVKSRGIQASRPFVGNGMWVTSLSDPDGYQIHFESNTAVPEDTEYAEHEH